MRRWRIGMLDRAVCLLGAFGALSAGSARAWQAEGEAKEASASEGESKDSKPDEKKDEKKEDTYFAVVGGDIYTGTGALLRGATLLAKNGKIEDIGYDLDVPEKAEILDATGLRIYPGLVAINSLGLLGNTGADFEDSFDPFNTRMILALGVGITTATQAGIPVKLRRGEIADAVLRKGYNTALVYSVGTPSSRRALVEKLDAVVKYRSEYRDWEEKKKTDKDLKEPSKKGVDAAILSVVEGKTLARFAATDRRDLIEIASLARKYGFRPILEGCREGWTVADELGRSGAFAIVNPRDRRNKSEEFVRAGGSSIENAAILHGHGVQVAVVPANPGIDLGGMVGRDIMHLPVEAAFAVRGGLSERAAIDSITIVPARILGIEDRVGSLEVGKDCDLIATDGDLLHYETFVQYAVVSGKLAYEKHKELFFAHIRPRPERELAPKERTDPGQEESKEEAEAKPEDEKSGDEPEKNEGETKDPPKPDEEPAPKQEQPQR